MFAVPIFAITIGIFLLFARFTLPRKGNLESSERAHARFERLFPFVLFSLFAILIGVLMFIQTR